MLNLQIVKYCAQQDANNKNKFASVMFIVAV